MNQVLISSSTSRLRLDATPLTEVVQKAAIGDVVAVEVLSVNPAYPNLELPDGSLVGLNAGDIVIGSLGSRQALRGFVGRAPTSLEAGCELALLNMGGVIGHFVDSITSLGAPTRVRYIGTAVDEDGVVNLSRIALPEASAIAEPRPIVLVIGTCMSVGKTATMAKLIESATRSGFAVGAAKLSGVGAIRDMMRFAESGAVDVKSFLDCGLPSTVDADDLAPITKTVVNALAGDLIIVELGDGIMGHYKVETVLTDADIMANVAAVVVCAGDITAAYGARHYLEILGVRIDVFSGLATENISGSGYIEEHLGIPAINGLKEPDRLFAALPLSGEWGVRSGESEETIQEEAPV
jgi:molybdopterin-guanine dinucleotide biosynthesis protein